MYKKKIMTSYVLKYFCAAFTLYIVLHVYFFFSFWFFVLLGNWCLILAQDICREIRSTLPSKKKKGFT